MVSLYRGRIKVLTNSTTTFTDGTAIVSIKNIAGLFHPMKQIEVASGKFNMVTTEAEIARLESELSFLQVKSTMMLQETILQVKAEICEDGKQIAHTRLESIAGVENPYSLMQVFRTGHQVTATGQRCI